jgi:hypothetical protein
MSKINKNILDEAIDVNGSKVFVENGEVRTVLREGLEGNDEIPFDEGIDLVIAQVIKYGEANGLLRKN